MPTKALKITEASDAGNDDDADIATAEVKVADLGEDARAEWRRSKEYLKQQIDNCVHILALNEITDLTDDILKTPAVKFEGGCKICGRARFVDIVCESDATDQASIP